MPELPDLITIEKTLRVHLPGRTIRSVEVQNPILLRCLGGVSAPEFLTGCVIERVSYHGPFVALGLDSDKFLIFHPMLAGRFSLNGSLKKAACLRLDFDEGDLTYHDDRQMGKIYLAHGAELTQIPKYLNQGVDILSPEFTAELLERLMGRSRKQVRVFIMDQTVLSSIGNAYADEILFHAGLHPKTVCSKLSAADRNRLYESIRNVMTWGIEEVARAQAPLYEKVRGHMKVRNRKGEPCPRCGGTIRRESVLGHDTFYCPVCQPPTRSGFIDWSKLPK